MRGRTVLTIASLVGIVMAALIGLLATRDPATERINRSRLIGQIAPDVSGTTIDGDEVSMDDYRGRWVALNFFASWCVPCLTEHPELMTFDRTHRAKGDAVLLAVTFGDTLDDAQAFFEEHGGSWPVINDPENSVAVTYGVLKPPETWLIAPNGVLVERWVGPITAEQLDDAITRFEGQGP